MDGMASLQVARLGVVDYAAALELQNALVAARIRDEIGDTLLLLEHPHVYTLGRGADASYVKNRPDDVPIHRVSRGGQVTYHGPGQLVGYPIVKLPGVRRDVSRYLRNLERALIDALREFGIEGARREGMTGVWAGPRKIASIGVGIRRWVTLHGFALNVATDLSYFDAIIPCGIEGCRMTSVAEVANRHVTVSEFADTFTRTFANTFEYNRVTAVNPNHVWAALEATGDGHEGFREGIEAPDDFSQVAGLRADRR
jgi:lipoate-protein ligase B